MATTDALTGLGNRRMLIDDLAQRVREADSDRAGLLILLDLNGFKNFNDAFGHPAGDVLLQRLGLALAAAIEPFGGLAYRPGGDEFCVVAQGDTPRATLEHAAMTALTEVGPGFEITASFGSAVISHDVDDPVELMRAADSAMYAQKSSGRTGAGRQSTDVLLRALTELHPGLDDHVGSVTDLVSTVGARLGMHGEELTRLGYAGALHDIGKVAVPETVINKVDPLDSGEWALLRRHTLIGERIMEAAPALRGAAPLVRSSHEAFDGRGYPDGLVGDAIPLGARIIAVCDAFDAMVSERSYSPASTIEQALSELRRCAGTQFDPAVVSAFEQVVSGRTGRAEARAEADAGPAPSGVAMRSIAA